MAKNVHYMVMNNTAENILSKIGGASVAADLLDVKIQTVYRWTYPKDRGGTGGTIPVKYHQAILDYAQQKKRPLKPVDFFNV